MTSSPTTGFGLHVVGPNPSMDRTQFLDRFQVGEVNRAASVEPMPGGKGLIVARALARLGSRASIYGFTGGVVGEYIRAECRRLDIGDHHTEVAEDTRINSVVVDRGTGDTTVVNEPGPRVSAEEVESLFATLASQLASGDIVALSGSLPRQVEPSFVARTITLAASRGARVIVDTAGEALRVALLTRPWAIKCNLEEIGEIIQDAPVAVHDEQSREHLVTVLQDLIGKGIGLMIVTLGHQGAVAVTAEGTIWARPPRIDVVNPTGSGDTFLAGFLHEYARSARLDEAMRFAVAVSAFNAALPLPDIGAKPDLRAALAGVNIEVER